jgi:predicted transcriptional regulator
MLKNSFRFVPFPVSLEAYFFKSTDTEKALIYYFLRSFHFNNFAKCIGSFSISQIAEDINRNRNAVGKSLKVLENDGLILCQVDNKNKKIKISFNRKYLNESPEDVQENVADICKERLHDVQQKVAVSATKDSSICKERLHDVQQKVADDRLQTIENTDTSDTAKNSFKNTYKNTYNNTYKKENDDVFFEKKLSEEGEGIYQDLIKVPDMDKDLARKILLEYPPEFIRQKINELPHRKILYSEGKTLYNSIKGKWGKPGSLVEIEKQQTEQENIKNESDTWLPIVCIWDRFFIGNKITKENAKKIITHKVNSLWKNTDLDFSYTLDFIEKVNKTKELMNFYDVVNLYPGQVEPMLDLVNQYEVI